LVQIKPQTPGFNNEGSQTKQFHQCCALAGVQRECHGGLISLVPHQAIYSWFEMRLSLWFVQDVTMDAVTNEPAAKVREAGWLEM
jgi:hypothetical protein